jgi:hypothetical protein
MAVYKPSKPPEPITIGSWRGVNESVGQTDLLLGEALRQVNYRITKDYKPKKRLGHKTFINYSNTKNVQGMWKGTIASKNVLISCNDGKVYEYNFSTLTNTQIGTMTDAKTSIFYFESKLYFMNGTEFKQYDGTTFQDVVPYVPTIAIATPPAGGGTDYETINLLTGAKKQEFITDGVATKFVIREQNIDATAVIGWYNGVQKAETTDFTVNRTTGEITTLVLQPDDTEIKFQWVKVTAGHADLVKKNRFAMTFGPGNDTAIFIWGNPDAKNRRSWSGTLNAGYWPATNFTLIGTNEFAITDIKTQNANYQMIFKEDRTFYSYSEYVTLTGTYDYPVKDLNEKVGNVAYNAVQIIKDNAVSIKGASWWLWNTAIVESQRNADIISEKLRVSLSALDLTTAVTFDYQSEKEYWCNVGSIVYIWNYGNDTMYTFDNISGTCFLDVDRVVYYGSQGTIERFEGLDDNGVEVTAQLETGFISYGAINLIKTSDYAYLGLLPDSRTSVTIYYRTNKKTEWKQFKKVPSYALMDFDDIDFDDFSFQTNRTPQTFPLAFTPGDYIYIQYRFENVELDETCVILDFLVNAETQGEIY